MANSQNPMAKDFDAIAKALDLGDMAGAQRAFASILTHKGQHQGPLPAHVKAPTTPQPPQDLDTTATQQIQARPPTAPQPPQDLDPDADNTILGRPPQPPQDLDQPQPPQDLDLTV